MPAVSHLRLYLLLRKVKKRDDKEVEFAFVLCIPDRGQQRVPRRALEEMCSLMGEMLK